MNTPVVYRVGCFVFDKSEFHPTKKAAMTSAAWWQTKLAPDDRIEVAACYINPNLKRRTLHCALLNGAGWMLEEEVVAVLHGTRKGEDDA